MILCTLAVCLSLLASVFTTQALVRAEGKRTRSVIPKALSEPLPGAGTESVIGKLDALNAQLASLSRRLALLEDAASRKPASTAAAAPDPVLTETRALATAVRGLAASEERLASVPRHLAELTTYLDQSFGHLEKKVDAVAATPEETKATLDALARKVDDIDHYFSPLYTFLGLTYDRDNDDLLAAYPSIDVRLSALFGEIEALHAAVADVRAHLMAPVVIEPAKRPR
jgi:prefoldin subunit 5